MFSTLLRVQAHEQLEARMADAILGRSSNVRFRASWLCRGHLNTMLYLPVGGQDVLLSDDPAKGHKN